MNIQEKAYMMKKDGLPIEQIAEILKIATSTAYKYVVDEKKARSEDTETKKQRYDPDLLRKQIEQGYTYEQLARLYDVHKSTVRKWCKKNGIVIEKVKKEKKRKEEAGINADRHLCATCFYRMTYKEFIKVGARCDYIGWTDRSRKCAVENCDKYVKGKPKKSRSNIVI